MHTTTSFEIRKAGRCWLAVAVVREPHGFYDEESGTAVDGFTVEEQILGRFRARRDAEEHVARQRFVVWPGDMKWLGPEED